MSYWSSVGCSPDLFAHQHGRMASGADLDMRDDRRGLAAAPQPRKIEVHPDHADGLTVEADIRHHRAARFERGEVNRLAIEDIGFLAHEDRVAVPSHPRRPRSERQDPKSVV